MSACTGVPVSWLRLERYALGELTDADRSEIATHLAACRACSVCFAQIEDAPAPALPVFEPVPRVRSRRLGRWPVWAGLASAAAAVLLLLGPGTEPPARRHVKGGDFALQLVRMDETGKLQEATRFNPADRFKVRVTCPPAFRGVVGVAVYQSGKTYLPLGVAALETCGNSLPVPGAFAIDGTQRALVCASFAADEAEWRAQVSRGEGTPVDGSVCVAIEPTSDRAEQKAR